MCASARSTVPAVQDDLPPGPPNRPTLAWEAADGRRAWNRTPEQDREIRRRSRQGFAYTVVYETGELVFHRRRETHPHWWRRGADDPNVKAARQAQRLHAVRAGQGRPTAPTPLPRRTPPARPAARRPAARRSLGARAGQDPGEDDPERPSPRGELRHVSHALADLLEEIGPRDLHLADLWWGSPRRLLDVLGWSFFPIFPVPEGWLTHCPACVRGPLLVTERRADHAEVVCGHGCSEVDIRLKLAHVEALASESIDGEVAA